jgi:outer membrane protein TolC
MFRMEVEAVSAREQQALAQDQKTVQTAFGEVRSAFSAQTRSSEAYAAETERARARRNPAPRAHRYENVLSSHLQVSARRSRCLQPLALDDADLPGLAAAAQSARW